MPTRKRRLYWDANCFIALFNNEPTTSAQQIDALRATFDDVLAGKLQIITSDLYRTEVFGENKEAAGLVADQLEACPDFEIVPLRTQAFLLAGRLREQCDAATPARKLKTADALHIAGATIARAEEIWTTETKLVRYYEDGLLTAVRVCLPYLTQMRITYN